MLIDSVVTLDQFESHIGHVSECKSSLIEIIYSFNYDAMSVSIHVPTQEDELPFYIFMICTIPLYMLLRALVKYQALSLLK